MLPRGARKAAKPILVRMTKPQLHRHLTTGIFNQIFKDPVEIRLSDFFWIELPVARQALELCTLTASYPVFARPNQIIN